MTSRPDVIAPVRGVVDAHHHLWDLEHNRYPWLQGPPQDPANRAGLGPLQRSYLLDDYLRDVGDTPLVASVHVEAAHDPADPLAETRWLQALADRRGHPDAIVAAVRLQENDVQDVLEHHAAHRSVRGVRQMLNWRPEAPIAERPDLLSDAAWRCGLALLGPLGLSFDLQVFPHQLRDAAAVAAGHPDVVFVLNHGGALMALDDDARASWRAGLHELAAQPNVYVKASAFAEIDQSLSETGLREFIHELLDAFGTDRTMFGSNFPLDARFVSFRELVSRCAAATRDLDERERDAFFRTNAMRVYRLTDV